MEQSTTKPTANLMEITYWSINRSSVSFTICLFLATALICFVAAAYADKATIRIQEIKNARCLLNEQHPKCNQ